MNIRPGIHWETWKDLRAGALARWRQACALAYKKCSWPPGWIPDQTKDDGAFIDAEEAFLELSARVLEMDRSTFEHAAVEGHIEWRENWRAGRFEVRHAGRVLALPLPELPA